MPNQPGGDRPSPNSPEAPIGKDAWPGNCGRYPGTGKRHRKHKLQDREAQRLGLTDLTLGQGNGTGIHKPGAHRDMAQYRDDEQYGEYDAGHYDQHMEDRLVEALDFHMQDSVNKALVKALRPFAQPIFNFGFRCFGAGSGNPTPVEVNINEPGRSSDDLLDQTATSVLSDHEYGAFKNR
ncbi:hypothetical protein NDU88_001411 [Pleurodeles waltl]|uniref:Uncharacterized protein n=1 Tax=Pleurodeles waltl TaxID=8319 RepID=A0AAV7S7Z0_PLEWA|nr:hypothetical protein NDU88_001411 [Pleurodeles waltl]